MTQWTQEKAEGKIPVDQVEELLKGISPPPFFPLFITLNKPHPDPQIHPLPSPHNANLWRLLIREGDRITSATQTVAVLEAMKLEINVPAGERMMGGVVEKVLVREGEVVGAGTNIVLVRKEGRE